MIFIFTGYYPPEMSHSPSCEENLFFLSQWPYRPQLDVTHYDVAHEYDLIAKSLLKMMVSSSPSQSATSAVFAAAVADLMVSVLFSTIHVFWSFHTQDLQYLLIINDDDSDDLPPLVIL